MKQKPKEPSSVWQFVRLQLSGNVLFWGTIVGSIFFHEVLGVAKLVSVAAASAIFHVVFFLLDKHWVFSTKTGKNKTEGEVVRFVIFMGLNYFLNLGLIHLVLQALAATHIAGVELTMLNTTFDIDLVLAQLVASAFFAVWSWLGLKYWVFRHARHAHHAALTWETKESNARRHRRYYKLATKQKAKRAA